MRYSGRADLSQEGAGERGLTIAAIVAMVAAAGLAACVVLFLAVALFGVGSFWAFGGATGPVPVVATPIPVP